ncbi:MAG: glycosyltransferase family 4 protein [Candidatus Sumerlaeia bacterium]|nr:glycosyltransferase family 4 protein [Candidatus Sumerlaeia bacterium]
MRISILTGPFFSIPPAPCGAVERIWWDIARAFAAQGHDVRLFCRAAHEVPARATVDGVAVQSLTAWRGTSSLAVNLLKDAAYAADAVRRLPPADILVTNTFWAPVAARLRPAAGRVVVNVARMPKGQMRVYHAAGVARLAAVSSAVAEAIRRECPRCAVRTRVLPNPIDTEHFVPVTRAWKAPHSLIYAGRIHPEKGLHVLLRAVRLLARDGVTMRTRLVGAWRTADGGGGEAYRARLERLARGLDVRFEDPVYDRTAFARLLGESQYFCYPSLAERGESFGVAPLEAMATGAVAIVSDLACFRDFVRPGQNALAFDHCAPDHAARLADVLRGVRDDPQACARLSAAAAETARAYSVPAIAARYLADFEELTRR